MLRFTSLLTVALLLGGGHIAKAQFPPTPEDVTILKSKLEDGVYISYKEPGICETTPGVKSYAGYVHLPANTLNDVDERQNYSINTFFWFFEARNDPHNAPLSIWMNGGPGSSSLLGLLSENGPCKVNPDSNSTVLNPWSWNNEVNMLYIDQPVQVGLSYDKLQNITYNTATGDIQLLEADQSVPKQNASFLVGTYPSQNRSSTQFGTLNAARALWHFAQTWFQEFPAYCPNDSRISIATESYGGRYGPAYSAFFEEQNQKIENGTWTEVGDMYILHMDSLLIINGCIDRQVQWPSYPHIVYNNTYDIKALNESVYESMLDAYYRTGGCRDQINDCRALAAQYDPTQRGLNASVNKVCASAENFCVEKIRDPYTEYSGRNYYDFGTFDPDPFPPPWYNGYLNQPHVQHALGVPLNFTSSSNAVAYDFRSIGDYPRDGWLQDLSFLLENGIKVALMYGDRDFACNWLGGELVSLAVNYTETDAFHAAGYTPLLVNGSDSAAASSAAGQVRQHGNFSFTRVYEAGHEVPAYQPEAAYRVFNRLLSNRDIATGEVNTAANNDYSTEGPSSSFGFKNKPPAVQPLHVCYTWDLTDLCTADQIEAVVNGSALIRNNFVVDRNSTALYPNLVGPPPPS